MISRNCPGRSLPPATGLEGFCFPGSGIDDEPEKIPESFKDRGLAEKIIHELKKGAEL
jgi:hypothetical protein